jgi:hypothetical protein
VFILMRYLAINHIIYYSLILCALLSCSSSQNKNKEDTKGKLLAEVKETKLYESDLLGLVTLGTSKSDSGQMVERYIHAWVRKQLLIQKAKTTIPLDEKEIERKLLDYKYDLIAYSFEKSYIEKNLDTSISAAEIKKYYEENAVNFELKQNIVKAILVKVPKNLPELEDFKLAFMSDVAEDARKANSFAVKYAEIYLVKDTVWTDFELIIKNSPFKSIPNKIDFLKTNRFSESSEQDFVYYLKIKDYKISNQISPINYVRERIKSMILNQRKLQLKRKLEKETFEEAQKNQGFKIYKNE